jgi:hypothetical protein
VGAILRGVEIALYPCLLAAPLLVACGGRTGLEIPSSLGTGDASPAEADASSGLDADAAIRCSDGGPPEVAYALDEVGTLYRFDPQTAQSQPLGTPDCGNGNVQWTMTASNDTAYIVYTDWTLYRVELATMVCTRTLFQASQLGLDGQFGVAVMGSGASERLYVYGLQTGQARPILAVADTISFSMSIVGAIQPAPPADSFPVNLTADAITGTLYAFSPQGWLQKIDPATGKVLDAVDSGVTSTSTWATIAYAPHLLLWVGPRVDGYDLETRARTSDRDAGVFAIGASAVVACPGG